MTSLKEYPVYAAGGENSVVALKSQGKFFLLAEADAKHFSSVLRTALELSGSTIDLEKGGPHSKTVEYRMIDLSELLTPNELETGLDVLFQTFTTPMITMDNVQRCYKVAEALDVPLLMYICDKFATKTMTDFNENRRRIVAAAKTFYDRYGSHQGHQGHSIEWAPLLLIPILARYSPEILINMNFA